MRSACLYQYELPMDSGVILRNQRLVTRQGWIVVLQDRHKTGMGEIAPLPGFSTETHEQAGEQAIGLLTHWIDAGTFDFSDLFPSVACGLSFALMELKSELPLSADYRSAPLCNGDPDDLVVRLTHMHMTGKKVAKVKVGMYEAVRDGIVTNTFLKAIPDLSLRLDANRQWTPLKAQQFAKYIQPQYRSRIAFVEEPCQCPEDSLVFSQETGIAIAWDESVRDVGFKVKAEVGVVAIVIKPTLIGSLDRCLELIDQAHNVGLEVIISSSLESTFGLTQLARLAAWKTPDTIPGLDTVQLFAKQLHQVWPDCLLPLVPLTDLEVIWQHK